MTLNQFMHPRNPFKQKPNFARLASKHLDLAQHLQHLSNGKCRLDFDCPEAVQALTRVLLKDTFDLDVQFLNDRLVPAIPQRLNYMLWIQDIYRSIDLNNRWIGLDIGTGSCAILPLLGTRLEPTWSFVGTEIDSQSITNANLNIAVNHLQDRIQVMHVNEQDSVLDAISSCNQSIQFVVCNPPFFKSSHQVSSDSGKRIKSDSNCAASFERQCEGGELAFITKMFEQSQFLAREVKLFSVMMGHKATFKSFKHMLRERADSVRFVDAELCQGRIIRHAIAWTFDLNITFDQVPGLKHKKDKAALQLVIDDQGKFKYRYHMAAVQRELMHMLQNDLQFKFVDVLVSTKYKCRLRIRSSVNTWSNQRRKRRQQQRAKQINQEMSSTVNDLPAVDSPREKRRNSEDDHDADDHVLDHGCHGDSGPGKRLKKTAQCSDQDANDAQAYLLHCELHIKQPNDQIEIHFKDIQSTSNQSVYQLYQYIKNRFQTDTSCQAQANQQPPRSECNSMETD